MAIPFFLYKIGSAAAKSGGAKSLLAPWIGGAGAPGGAKGSVRSMFAFWSGGAGAEAITGPSVGSSISGGYFSRGRWRKLRDEMIAAHDAAVRAAQLKSEKARAALIRASSEAKKAIAEAEESRAEIDRELASMRRALEAATGASRISAAIRHAKAATEYAKAVRQAIEDQEEEEDIVTIFSMLH